MKPILTAILLLFFSVSQVSAHWDERDLLGQYIFGYSGVEHDLATFTGEIEANNIPTNVQLITVNAATDDIGPKVSFLNSHGQRAIVVLDNLLFKQDPKLNTPCGANAWRYRLDYKLKFDNWLMLNAAHVVREKVAILVVNTEVNNRCISLASLDEVAQYVGTRTPLIPAIAAYDGTSGAQPLPAAIPSSLAGIGFYRYHTLDPRSDPTYQSQLNHLKSRMTADQRLVLVPESFYDSFHEADGWPKWYLGVVALNYARLALADPKVVGLVFFRWSTWQEFGETKLGAVNLPQGVRDRHREAACMLKVTNPFVAPCP